MIVPESEVSIVKLLGVVGTTAAKLVKEGDYKEAPTALIAWTLNL